MNKKTRKIIPDIIARVEFYPTEKGGKKIPTPSNFFNCPLEFNNRNNYFDCRMLLDEIGAIYPGGKAIVPIKFLDPETVLSFIEVGDKFRIWDGRFVGEGEVIDIVIQ